MDWPEQVPDLLARCTFPAAGATLTCAVSGGADSLALMTLARAAGCQVTAVHVDHGLRPGSDEEGQVVAAAAVRFGAHFRQARVEVGGGPNLEARARAARYAALPSDVATGHTMDDQAETVLLNLLRGSGTDGLAAMAPGPRHPLLALRRNETRELCRSLGLAWVEDPSNDDPRHLRNRVRHELLPLCAALARRDPVPLLARTAGLLREEGALLDALALDAVPEPSDARVLVAAPRPLARRAIRRWLREAHPPSAADVDRVLVVAEGGAVATQLSGGRRLRRSSGRLMVEATQSSPVGQATQSSPVGQATQSSPVGQATQSSPVGQATQSSPVGQATQSSKVTPMQTEEAAPAAAWASSAVGSVLVSAEAIADRIAQLGAQITADYADDPPLLVGVLKGAMMFMSDLCRQIQLPVDVDFMAVSSYGSATRTSGVVRIVKDLDAELMGRQVLVVEDIIDSGLTLNYLRRYLHARSPASIEVCALLVKEGEQRVDLDLRYVGFVIPPDFVIGYGLDVAERYRNLPGVHVYRGGSEELGSFEGEQRKETGKHMGTSA